MTVAPTNGEKVWAFRYSSEHDSRSRFYSTNVATLRDVYAELELLCNVSDHARLVVSEPLRDLPGAWNEVPESSYGVVHRERHDELREFTPRPPAKPTALPVG
jgi:hypothetical protein